MVYLLIVHPDKGESGVRVVGMPDVHQGVVSDDLSEDICSSIAPLFGAVLYLEGDGKVPTENQALVRTQVPKVGCHLPIEKVHLCLMCKGIRAY